MRDGIRRPPPAGGVDPGGEGRYLALERRPERNAPRTSDEHVGRQSIVGQHVSVVELRASDPDVDVENSLNLVDVVDETTTFGLDDDLALLGDRIA